MNGQIRLGGALCALYLSISAAAAQPQVLTADQWRADMNQLDEAIRQGHPNPFAHGDEAAYTALLSALDQEIETLADKVIILRMAEIAATINDGHTRLAIPREHPQIGLEFGHKPTPAPKHDAFKFKQLPVAFEKFEDGIFIVAATAEYEHLIGSRLDAINDTPAQAAFTQTARLSYAENQQLKNLMGADRLSMPEVLTFLGVSEDPSLIRLTLTTPDGGENIVTLTPVLPGPFDWRTAFAHNPPLRAGNPDKKFWSQYIRKNNVLYAQINEIGDGEITFAEFATKLVREAERRNARLVIDLRRNFGGSGDLNRTLILAILQSPEMNSFGKTFVLTGPRTFSAAGMLVMDLERFTRVLFTGEPTGAKPDNFGDARRIRLTHSDLTLRVSSLHWSSYLAYDSRESVFPDERTPWTSQACFSGGDPALERVISYPAGDLKRLWRSALVHGDGVQLSRYLASYSRSPDTQQADITPDILELGAELVATGQIEHAKKLYLFARHFYPHNEALAAVAEKF